MLHTVQLRKGGDRFDDLEIEDVYDGDRDESRALLTEGGVMFRTLKGKRWFMKFSEFSFVLNEPDARATQRRVKAA